MRTHACRRETAAWRGGGRVRPHPGAPGALRSCPALSGPPQGCRSRACPRPRLSPSDRRGCAWSPAPPCPERGPAQPGWGHSQLGSAGAVKRGSLSLPHGHRLFRLIVTPAALLAWPLLPRGRNRHGTQADGAQSWVPLTSRTSLPVYSQGPLPRGWDLPANLSRAVVSKHSSPRSWPERSRSRSRACGVQLHVGGLGPATHSRGRPGQSARPDVCALTAQWRGRRGQSAPPWEREACWASGRGRESLRGTLTARDLLRALALLPGNPWSLVSGLGGPRPPSLREPGPKLSCKASDLLGGRG